MNKKLMAILALLGMIVAIASMVLPGIATGGF